MPLNLINKELLCVTIQTKITTVDLIANAHTEIHVSATVTEKTTVRTQEKVAVETKEENTEEETAVLAVSAIFSAVADTK